MKFRSILHFFILLFSLVSVAVFSDEEPCEINSDLPPAPPWAKIHVNGYRYAEGDRSFIQFYGRTQAFRPKDGNIVATTEGEEPSVYRVFVTRRHSFETDFVKINEKDTRIEIFFQAGDGSWFSTSGFANTVKNGFCGFSETGRADKKF